MRVKPYIESRRTKPNADFAKSTPLILSQRAVDSLGRKNIGYSISQTWWMR